MEREIPVALVNLARVAELIYRIEYERQRNYRLLERILPTVEAYLPPELETVAPSAEVIPTPAPRRRQPRLTAADRKMLREFGIR